MSDRGLIKYGVEDKIGQHPPLISKQAASHGRLYKLLLLTYKNYYYGYVKKLLMQSFQIELISKLLFIAARIKI